MIVLIDTDVYKLQAEVIDEVAFLHMDYNLPKFTKTIYKELLLQWWIILEKLKVSGIEAVASLIPENWDKVHKWQEMFGLEPTHVIDGKILFRRLL